MKKIELIFKHSFVLIFLICFFLISIKLYGSEYIHLNSSKENFDHNFNIKGANVISGFPMEGNLVIARTKPSNKIFLDNQKINLSKDGIFVIGFDRDSDVSLILDIISNEGETLTTDIFPRQRSYKTQRIKGLKKSMVQPPRNILERIKIERKLVQNVREIEIPMGDFPMGFNWPLLGKISGVFGSQRILNDVPKSPHYGVDIAAPKGTFIRAPASGQVSLVEDLYYSGLTVVLNHGLGVNSTFLHLENSMVKVGDKIKREEIIGTVGSTGRSTGPHLDWRIDWKGKRLDAQLLTGPMPEF